MSIKTLVSDMVRDAVLERNFVQRRKFSQIETYMYGRPVVHCYECGKIIGYFKADERRCYREGVCDEHGRMLCAVAVDGSVRTPANNTESEPDPVGNLDLE